MKLQLLWEGLLWFPWSWRSIQASLACFRLQTWHWHDRTKCSEIDIFNKVDHKNKQTKKGGSFPFYSPLTQTSNKQIRSIFSEFRWTIVFTKITSHISKPSSVFDKLGLTSKYRGNNVCAHSWVKKNAMSQGIPKLNHCDRGNHHPQPGGKKEGTVN